ncbi:MAG: BrnA antitoxin family protein [Deltaproteobacteria bacterium]|nr:BrnA antitoxin family protein [Deltaproteobacteria bacterium]
MKHSKEFPFHKARRLTLSEARIAQKAISDKLGIKRPFRGRPPKEKHEKYHAISIRLDPRVMVWAKKEAGKKGLKYQSIINKVLLNAAA